MNTNWSLVIDIAMLAALLCISILLKRIVPFLRNYPVPVPMIAGFIGLLCGPEILGLINFDNIRLENVIYHMMSVGFIALSLKSRKRERGREYVNSGIFIVSTYVIQGILGFGLSLLLFYTIMPGLFPSMGLLLPLGYGQGPGQAYSIGHQWEAVGLKYGGNLGLTIAALGNFWACIVGVPLIKYLKKKYPVANSMQNDINTEDETPEFMQDKHVKLPMKESIDGITIQLVLIGVVYLLTYLFLDLITSILENTGTLGQTLAKLLWGFAFIFGVIIAMLLKTVLDALKSKGIIKLEYTSDFLLERISGGAFDFMITASIAVISIYMLKDYLLPVALISTLGGVLTVWYVIVAGRVVYKSEKLENILAMYGMLTGTISTGLVLLREVDPGFKTQAAKNLVFGSGTGLLFGFPLMILLGVPVVGYTQNNQSLYIITMGILVLYLLFLYVIFRIIQGRKTA